MESVVIMADVNGGTSKSKLQKTYRGYHEERIERWRNDIA